MTKEINAPIFLEMANYTSPMVIEVPSKKWVWYGEDNNYFGYLLDRYRGSPTNHAIINGVAESIVGDGLTSPFAHKHPASYAKAKLMFPDGDLERWAFDLKCFGFYVQQIIDEGATGEIDYVIYTPVQNWRSGKADANGDIHWMFYSDDWTQINKRQFTPRPFPVYNPDMPHEISIYTVKPYRTGSFYYPTVDYQGCLQYANLEEEIANFHFNNIMNGLSPSMLINFNNGDPGQEKRNEMERSIQKKWGGTKKAGGWILAFNDDKEKAATIETVEISDLDKQYQFLSEESTKKIMVGHRVTSPYFFGIRDAGGFGSNADEIKNAWLLWERTVLRSYRKLMIEHMEYLLDQNGSHIPLEFIPLAPIEFKDAETTLKRHYSPLDEFINMGEEIDPNEWELVDEGEVDYEIEKELDLTLASTGTARPDANSKQDAVIDGVTYKVRYEYTGSNSPEREFCVKMMGAKKLYRKEDIEMMSKKPVNPGWGARGADTYDIFLYKGGGNCHHSWRRKTFASKKDMGVTPSNPLAPTIGTREAEIDGYKIRNAYQVSVQPKNLPNKGFLPSNPQG